MITDPNDFFMGEPPEEDDDDQGPPWITARYDGVCSSCAGSIFADVTEIRADGYGGWECC